MGDSGESDEVTTTLEELFPLFAQFEQLEFRELFKVKDKVGAVDEALLRKVGGEIHECCSRPPLSDFFPDFSKRLFHSIQSIAFPNRPTPGHFLLYLAPVLSLPCLSLPPSLSLIPGFLSLHQITRGTTGDVHTGDL